MFSAGSAVRISTLPVDEEVKRGVENEILLLWEVAHPTSVIGVHGLCHDRLSTGIVIELVECSPWSIVSKPSTIPDLPLALAMAWLTNICAAVAYLHKKMVNTLRYCF